MHPVYMVMGVSGCGKSTIGQAFADRIGGVFLDGDDYHPPKNIARMTAGEPLTDEMRWPWLDLLAVAVNAARQDHAVVFACSALKRRYRDHLRDRIDGLQVCYLDAPREVVSARLSARADHFMPPALLDSQYATLEVPRSPAAVVRIDQPIADIVSELERLV